jgi:hexosaminidase
VEAILDLGNAQKINSVVVHALNSGGTYVYPPKGVEVFGSADGKTFKSLGTAKAVSQVEGPKAKMKVDFKPANTRFVKVVVKNQQTVPTGKQGEGEKTWLFLDEIEVN